MSRKQESAGRVEDLAPIAGQVRIAVLRHVPPLLRRFGADPSEALEAAAVSADLFDDPDNMIGYGAFLRLLGEAERLTGCDHVGMLVGQHVRLADFGLAGRVATCSTTAGSGLREFVRLFNLHSSATFVSVVESGEFSRLVHAISGLGGAGARQLELGSMAAACNLLQDLFGHQWRPTEVTFATRPPSNLRPLRQFFRAPLRFNNDESAVTFEQHWLDRQLPPLDPALRRQCDADLRKYRTSLLANIPAAVRGVMRSQRQIRGGGIDEIAAIFSMHRRTLDRHLRRHGTSYGEILEGVNRDIACQLLRDTQLQVQQIAEALNFSSAANFATAFRRWTGTTPSAYRRTAS